MSESPVCPPTPTVLNIGQFLNEDLTGHGWSQQKWLLAYACMLQHMGKATDWRTWRPNRKCFTPQISMLVYAFLEATGAEMVEADVAHCWGQLPQTIPGRKVPLLMLYSTLTIWLNICSQVRPGMSWFACHLLQCPAPSAGVGTWATYKVGGGVGISAALHTVLC